MIAKAVLGIVGWGHESVPWTIGSGRSRVRVGSHVETAFVDADGGLDPRGQTKIASSNRVGLSEKR